MHILQPQARQKPLRVVVSAPAVNVQDTRPLPDEWHVREVVFQLLHRRMPNNYRFARDWAQKTLPLRPAMQSLIRCLTWEPMDQMKLPAVNLNVEKYR